MGLLLAVIICSFFSPTSGALNDRVVLGNEVLRSSNYSLLRNKTVAILSNPTGVFQDSYQHIVDNALANNVNVKLLLSPEHGFRGDHQAETGDPILYVDNSTGLPVLSAYKLNSSELADALASYGIDCVLVDIQDVGVRLYTFIWTMYNTMISSAEIGARFVVLDRPNPLGGLIVDGPLLNVSCCASGYGRAPITHIHGMTIAELALLFQDYIASTIDNTALEDLEIVKMEGWSRRMTWDMTLLDWIPPSPNLPTPLSSMAYGATVFIEATTIAEGRGTTTPFTLFGAPFLDANLIASQLNEPSSPSHAFFRAAYFSPSFSKYNNTDCAGVQWVRGVQPLFASAVDVLITLKELSPSGDFVWDGSWFGHPGSQLIDMYAGTPLLRERIDSDWTTQDIVRSFSSDAESFFSSRKQFLLYN